MTSDDELARLRMINEKLCNDFNMLNIYVASLKNKNEDLIVMMGKAIDGFKKIDSILWSVSGKQPKQNPQEFVNAMDSIEGTLRTIFSEIEKDIKSEN